MERTREGVLGWVRAQGRRVTMRELERATGINKKVVARLFPGGWGEVLSETGWAGGTRRVDAREVVARLAKLERKLGRKVTWNELARQGRKGNDAESLECKEPGDAAHGEGGTGTGEGESGQGSGAPIGERQIGGTGDQYGRPLTASAVACAPINELGVVCLFGAMAAELGFFVLRVRAGFPDCEALRKAEGDRWERVRVEFEFKSGNFARHGHDARGCDVIVCWEHDWPGCPLEVVELRSKVGGGMAVSGGGGG